MHLDLLSVLSQLQILHQCLIHAVLCDNAKRTTFDQFNAKKFLHSITWHTCLLRATQKKKEIILNYAKIGPFM